MNEMINEMLKNSGVITQEELNESVQGKVRRHIKKLELGKKELNRIIDSMDKMLLADLKAGNLSMKEKEIPGFVKEMHRPFITIEKGVEKLIKRLRKLEIDAVEAKTKEQKAKVLIKFKDETDKDRTLAIMLKLMKDNKKALRKTKIFIFLVGFSAVMMLSSFAVPGLVGLFGSVAGKVGLIAGATGAAHQSLKAWTSAQNFTMFTNIVSDFPIVALKNFFVTVKDVKTPDEGERLATKLEKTLGLVA